MTSLIETLSMAVLLILAVMFLSHLINGSATDWLSSKFQVDDPNKK